MSEPKRTRCCSSVIAINAARPFKRYAEVLDRRRVQQVLDDRKGCRILEVGAGCLRNALYLQSRGFGVTVLEVKGIDERFPEQYRRFSRAGGKVIFSLDDRCRYDISLATFVFETICRPHDRIALLRMIVRCLKPASPLIASTRGPADLVTAKASGIPCSDGFLTPTRTFSRSFTRRQFSSLLQAAGFSSIEFLHGTQTEAPEYLHSVAWNGEKGG